jgi:hypothetical protein
MDVLEIKGSLFDLLWAVDDPETLLKIRALVFEAIENARKESPDWWDELTPEQQARLDRAMAEAVKGVNLVPHGEAMRGIEARFKSLRHGA